MFNNASAVRKRLVDHLQPALDLLRREAAGQPAEESAAKEQPPGEEAATQC